MAKLSFQPLLPLSDASELPRVRRGRPPRTPSAPSSQSISQLITRASLEPPRTLVAEFHDIRNYLAGNATGITRDAEIAEQLILLLFCKLYDERSKGPSDPTDFRLVPGEPSESLRARVLALLEQVKHHYEDTYTNIFTSSEPLQLDAKSLAYVVGRLQQYDLSNAHRDVLGEAFEAFIGPALRGDEGQFFTPRNVVKLAVAMTDPKPNDLVIDPACGSGGFLTVALEHVWRHIDADGVADGLDQQVLAGRLRAVAGDILYGLDKDAFLTKITRSYLALVGDGRAAIFCENSLLPPQEWSAECQERMALGKFTILLTNPPFGAKIPVDGAHTLRQYSLGYKWRKLPGGAFEQTRTLHDNQPPQILFIERSLQFLAPGGRMAIVLPEGILGNVNDGYVRQLIRDQANIVAIVDCPLETFLPSTPTKVALVILQKKRSAGDPQGPVFMAIAESCGHDRRGVPRYKTDGTLDDDFPAIAEQFAEFRRTHNVRF